MRCCGFLRRVGLVPLAVMLLAMGMACGGDETFDLMSFEDLPVDTAEAAEGESFALSSKEALLVKITYLHTHLILLETMQRVNRDMQGLLEYDSKLSVDLEWVIEVHEVTADAEAFFERATRLEVPVSLGQEYTEELLAFLEIVQWAGFASDRLLAASLAVGPSGRTLQVMDREEEEEFERYVREAEFFLKRAAAAISKEITKYEGFIVELER